MKEINIGRVLIKNRHKRGITQDELANHLGVSKGAVSKWETGCSLPVALPYDFKKFTLHQRIKTTGWLIHKIGHPSPSPLKHWL